MMGIKIPELHTQFAVGSANVYVVDIDTNYDGRTVVTGHDDNGEEVEIIFHPGSDD